MSSKKNNNSLLFLATLGVYIGLVLVGAPTGIVAQPAATTRNFTISDEFEVKENLDKDPEKENILEESLTAIIFGLDRLARRDSFDWKKGYDLHIESFTFGENGFPAFLSSSNNINDDVSNLLTTESKLFAASVINLSRDFENECSGYDFEFSHEFTNELHLEVKINCNDRSKRNAIFEQFRSNLALPNKLTSKVKLTASTKPVVSDTSVVLTTHLARSEIDHLLNSAK